MPDVGTFAGPPVNSLAIRRRFFLFLGHLYLSCKLSIGIGQSLVLPANTQYYCRYSTTSAGPEKSSTSFSAEASKKSADQLSFCPQTRLTADQAISDEKAVDLSR
ncbi:hypothetical protein PCASD_26112 [Puccinia coronata f. sp. avenae]|uniref:Uncharacterized protein n=1 Tax=Puccinia coronata f. sp. avenae TaxID=200324 RepID=A0A2N5RWA4_9BASI|nr:hypothetical protein PCASD_26112 [Puccinia coronata f. sp. avenae]